MRAVLLLVAVVLLAAAAPTPPERPPEKQAETAPVPPEKPQPEEAEAAEPSTEGAVPLPPDGPAPAEDVAPAGEQAQDTEDAASGVPLPPEVPDDIERAHEEEDEADDRPVLVDTTKPIAEAACRIRLRKLPVEWERVGKVEGEGRCAIGQAVRVTAIDGIDVAPPATVNCRTAEALALWARDDLVPAAKRHLDEAPAGLRVAGSYVCRNRNGQSGGRISEHAFGNAVDVSAFVFGDETVPVARQEPAENAARAAFQAEIRAAACERFTTVLGPGANAAHRSHFHFDLRQRSGGYRLCQ